MTKHVKIIKNRIIKIIARGITILLMKDRFS